MRSNIDQQNSKPGKLSLYTNHGKEFFFAGQIIRLEAKSNYTKIYFTDRLSIVTAKVLKEFEPLLMPCGFLRIHRRHLVNKEFILQVCNDKTVIMNDRSTAEISKRKKVAVLKALQVLEQSN